MSQWSATKARRVLTALLRIGWSIKRQSGGSHKILSRPVLYLAIGQKFGGSFNSDLRHRP